MFGSSSWMRLMNGSLDQKKYFAKVQNADSPLKNDKHFQVKIVSKLYTKLEENPREKNNILLTLEYVNLLGASNHQKHYRPPYPTDD